MIIEKLENVFLQNLQVTEKKKGIEGAKEGWMGKYCFLLRIAPIKLFLKINKKIILAAAWRSVKMERT